MFSYIQYNNQHRELLQQYTRMCVFEKWINYKRPFFGDCRWPWVVLCRVLAGPAELGEEVVCLFAHFEAKVRTERISFRFCAAAAA